MHCRTVFLGVLCLFCSSPSGPLSTQSVRRQPYLDRAMPPPMASPPLLLDIRAIQSHPLSACRFRPAMLDQHFPILFTMEMDARCQTSKSLNLLAWPTLQPSLLCLTRKILTCCASQLFKIGSADHLIPFPSLGRKQS